MRYNLQKIVEAFKKILKTEFISSEDINKNKDDNDIINHNFVLNQIEFLALNEMDTFLFVLKKWLNTNTTLSFSMDISMNSRTCSAVIISLLTPNASKRIISELTIHEKDILIREIIQLPSLTPEKTKIVSQQFLLDFQFKLHQQPFYAPDVAKGVFTKEELEEMFDRVYAPKSEPFGSLKLIKDVTPLLSFLLKEDIQTIAVVVSHLNPLTGGDILEQIPSEQRMAVIKAIATLKKDNDNAWHELEDYITNKIQNALLYPSVEDKGIKTVATLLNHVSKDTKESILVELENQDIDLTNSIRQYKFCFNDFLSLNSFSFQKMLNQITDNEIIVKALKNTDKDFKLVFYNHMAQARAVMVDDMAEDYKYVPLNEIKEAQQFIVNVAVKMEAEGLISFHLK